MIRADQSNIYFIRKVGKFVVDYPRVECGNILLGRFDRDDYTLHWIRNDQNWKQYVQHMVNEIHREM